MADWGRAIIAHLVWPVIVLLLFLRARARMHSVSLRSAPIIETVALFVVYGGLAHLWITQLLAAPWSAIASLEAAFLMLVAPLLMLALTWRLWMDRQNSPFHRKALVASLLYPVVLLSSLGFGILIAGGW